MHETLRCALQAHFTRTHIVGDMTTDQRDVLTTASRLLQVGPGLHCSCRWHVDNLAVLACSTVPRLGLATGELDSSRGCFAVARLLQSSADLTMAWALATPVLL